MQGKDEERAAEELLAQEAAEADGQSGAALRCAQALVARARLQRLAGSGFRLVRERVEGQFSRSAQEQLQWPRTPRAKTCHEIALKRIHKARHQPQRNKSQHGCIWQGLRHANNQQNRK